MEGVLQYIDAGQIWLKKVACNSENETSVSQSIDCDNKILKYTRTVCLWKEARL